MQEEMLFSFLHCIICPLFQRIFFIFKYFFQTYNKDSSLIKNCFLVGLAVNLRIIASRHCRHIEFLYLPDNP